MSDVRFPYTYACDYIRAFGGVGAGGTNLSRSDASQIRKAIADAIGIDDVELAKKLAECYLANQAEITAKSMSDFSLAMTAAREF